MTNKEYYNRNKKLFEDMLKDGIKKLPSKDDLLQMKKEGVKFLGLPIPREAVETCEITLVANFFNTLRSVGKHFKGSVLFSISGYDEDSRELYEIEEVVKFIRRLLMEVPFAFYYIYEESWAFMKACIAKEIKLVGKNGKDMDMYEISERLAKGLPVTEYQLMLTIEGHVLDNIVKSIKIEGSKVNDMRGAFAIADNFSRTFRKEK